MRGKKTKQKQQKNYGVCSHADKNGMCTGKNKRHNDNNTSKKLQITVNHSMLICIGEMLLKIISMHLFYVDGVS